MSGDPGVVADGVAVACTAGSAAGGAVAAWVAVMTAIATMIPARPNITAARGLR